MLLFISVVYKFSPLFFNFLKENCKKNLQSFEMLRKLENNIGSGFDEIWYKSTQQVQKEYLDKFLGVNYLK